MSIAESTVNVEPGRTGTVSATWMNRYENFIGGDGIAPTTGRYRGECHAVDRRAVLRGPDSGSDDIELALDAQVAKDH